MACRKQRVLIVTDSLGAPRSVDEEVINYETTWVYKITTLLTQHNIEVVFMTINGLDSNGVLQLTKDKLLLYEPSIILFQFGIVDCAPRVLTNKEIMFFSIFRLSRIVKKIISKYHAFFSSLRKLQYTDINAFKVNLEQIYELCYNQDIKIVHMPIAPACSKYEIKSPLISQNIKIYNNVIEKYTNEYLSDLYYCCEKEKIFLKDLHHLNEEGHNVVFNYLKNNLERIFNL